MNAIMDLFSLNGKNAVVTGANTGLGQGICVALAAAGAHVFGVARRSCDETAAKIAAYFGVSVDYLLGNEEKPAATEDSELIKSDPLADQLFAAYNGGKEVFDQDDINDIKTFMEMIVQRKRRTQKKE